MLENVGKLKQNCGDARANSDDVVLQHKTPEQICPHYEI